MRSKFWNVAVAISALSFFLLYFPLLCFVALSGLSKDVVSGDTSWTWAGYTGLLQNTEVLNALEISLKTSALSTLSATILGTISAYVVTRFRFPGRKLMQTLTLAPMVVPEIVLGLSLLIWFVFLRFTLGQASIILAHITFTMSYVHTSVAARLTEVDRSLEEAAQDLGARPWEVFFFVVLPNLRSAILSGAMMAFTLAFDDFFIAFFTAGVGSDTLPLKIYSLTKYGLSQEINALSTLMLLSTILILVWATAARSVTQRR
ncbi:MAG: ABC transporter permease [Bdellovibrionales bacterium]|nr:ABC transporter permease [Bdellovibrionales bacterium]